MYGDTKYTQKLIGIVSPDFQYDRPDRIEPRAVKRRPKKLIYLNEPRSIAKKRLLSGT